MKTIAISVSLLFVAGCMAQDPTPAPGGPIERPGAGGGDHHPVEPGAGAGLRPAAERLTLVQVALSFRAILNQPWTVSNPAGERVTVDEFAYALGYPDYYNRTAEDLEPHLLYAKFLHEGALAACGDAVEADLSAPRAGRTVLRQVEVTDRLPASEARILENIRDLKLRFHGMRLPEGDPRLSPYVELFAAASSLPGSGPADGWRALCVALIDEPEFSFR